MTLYPLLTLCLKVTAMISFCCPCCSWPTVKFWLDGSEACVSKVYGRMAGLVANRGLVFAKLHRSFLMAPLFCRDSSLEGGSDKGQKTCPFCLCSMCSDLPVLYPLPELWSLFCSTQPLRGAGMLFSCRTSAPVLP